MKNFYKTGKGQNIIFLHGWQDNKSTWLAPVDYLKNSFTCWMLDLPGFGKNPLLDTVVDPMDYANWVLKFIAKHDIKEYSVVGHSFGGRVAICLASKYPAGLKKIVLSATPGFPNKTSLFNKLLISFYRRAGIKNITFLKKSKVFKIIQSRLRSQDYQNANLLKKVFISSINYNLEPGMRKIKVPALIIHGREDAVVPVEIAEKMRRIIRSSKIILTKGSHYLHQDNPLLFSGILRNFFNETQNI